MRTKLILATCFLAALATSCNEKTTVTSDIIEQNDIPPPHLFGQEMRSGKRYTPPIAPLVHQHLLTLIEGVLHAGRRDGAGGYGKHLDQQHNKCSRDQDLYVEGNARHGLLDIIHTRKQSVPSDLSIEPATVRIE